MSAGVALISGSAQGIGKAIALRLAANGFNVGLNDVPSKKGMLETLATHIQKLGRKAVILPANVALESEVEGMVHQTTTDLGSLDVVSVSSDLRDRLSELCI